MVGTTHAPARPPRAGTPVDSLIAGLDGSTRERSLLLAAGAAVVYRAAGMIPATQSAPEPSPADTLPVCSPQASRLLADVFDDRHADLLPEAIALLRRAGHRLPPYLLPRALDAGAPDLRAALLPVLGERGRWLARHNPAWSWVAEADLRFADTLPPNAETIWQEGTPAQRLAILTKLRETNPTQARDWLIATWKAERADTRATLLGTLETNLSIEDEAFLDAAIDDRSEKVRNTAIPLLARLPDSAFAARLRRYGHGVLDFTPPHIPGRQGALSVTVPDEVDAQWRRDINDPPPLSDSIGSYQAVWARHTVALIPPSHWSTRFHATPADIIVAAEQTDFAKQLIDGFTRAALLHRDSHWAGALWDYWLRHAEHTGGHRRLQHTHMLASLPALLAPAEAERHIQTLFQQGANLQGNPWHELVADLPTPWSEDFSAACLTRLRDFAQASTFAGQLYYNFWSQSLDTIARSIAPACFLPALEVADPVADRLSAGPPADWQLRQRDEALARFAATIRLRRRIRQVLAS
jgi:hypothetical protein